MKKIACWYWTGYFLIMSKLNHLYNAEKILMKCIRNGGIMYWKTVRVYSGLCLKFSEEQRAFIWICLNMSNMFRLVGLSFKTFWECCGTVGRLVATDTRGPRFKSQQFMNLVITAHDNENCLSLFTLYYYSYCWSIT